MERALKQKALEKSSRRETYMCKKNPRKEIYRYEKSPLEKSPGKETYVLPKHTLIHPRQHTTNKHAHTHT